MSSIFGGQKAPLPKPPAPMPDEQSPAVLEAKRREAERIMSRGGRRSTILSAPEDRGGGFDAFNKRELGS